MALRILILALLVALSGGYARHLAAHRAGSPGVPALERVPGELPGWRSRDIRMSAAVENVLRADAYIFREYRDAAGASVSLFVGYFSDQKVGAQIHSPRNCLPGAGWNILTAGTVSVAAESGGREATRLVLVRQGARQEALYWFRTRSGSVTGEYALKWDLVVNSLRGRPTDAAFIRFMSAERDTAAMAGLVRTLGPSIDDVFAGVGLR